MDIVQSETLRGFTELTLFYMSDLDDSSCSLLSSLLFSFSLTSHNALPKLFVCVLVIERSAKGEKEKKNREGKDKKFNLSPFLLFSLLFLVINIQAFCKGQACFCSCHQHNRLSHCKCAQSLRNRVAHH